MHFTFSKQFTLYHHFHHVFFCLSSFNLTETRHGICPFYLILLVYVSAMVWRNVLKSPYANILVSRVLLFGGIGIFGRWVLLRDPEVAGYAGKGDCETLLSGCNVSLFALSHDPPCHPTPPAEAPNSGITQS